MKATPSRLPDVWGIEPRVFGGERGFFFGSYNEQAFNEATGVSRPADRRAELDNYSSPIFLLYQPCPGSSKQPSFSTH